MGVAKTVVTEGRTSITLSRVANQVKLKKCTVFELDSFTKYPILKNPNDKCLYAKNTRFGWMKCGDNVTKDLAQSQIKILEKKIGKEVMLKDTGQRNRSTVCHQKDLKQVRDIEVVDTGIGKNTCNMMPFIYLQEIYPSNNSCMWLPTRLAVHLFNPTQSENILRLFIKN